MLRADFTPPSEKPSQEIEDNAFASLLAHHVLQPVERIDAKYVSAENVELGQAIERLVEPAPVTASFKGFIADEVRRAHAWGGKVDEVVSPERLGLQSGEGIFDAAQAQDIEVRTLRAYSFRIIDQFIAATIEGEDETASPQLFLLGSTRPSDYRTAVDALDEWIADYKRTYDDDPFDGLDREVTLSAIGQIVVPEGSGTAELIKRLRQIRGESELE